MALEDDELEVADEEAEANVEPVIEGEAEAAVAVPDLDPEIEEEIKRALIPEVLDEEGGAPKAKTHQIPQSLIDSELTAEDLYDEGSI